MVASGDHIYVNQDVTEYIRKTGVRHLKSVADTKDGDVYAIILHPRMYIHGEGCVIRRGGGKLEVHRKDGSTEAITSLIKPLRNGGRLITADMMEVIYKYVRSGWSLTNITGIPGDTKFLQNTPESPPNRVIVVVPILPEQIETCRAITNTVISTLRGTIGASLLLLEAEPGEIFRDDTRYVTSVQMGIEIAREEFAKVKDSPGVVRSVVVPTLQTVMGMFTPEELSSMLYNAIINRERNSGWTLTARGEASKDVVRVAEYTGKLQKASIYAVSDTMRVNDIPILTTRIRLMGGDAYPKNKYAFYQPTGDTLRIGDSLDKDIHAEFETKFKKIKSGIPFNVECYSEYYRTAMLSHTYRLIRLVSKENIKKARKLFQTLLRYGTANVETLCGIPIRESDIPADVLSSGLVGASQGKTTFQKNIGYVVTLDGTDSWVVVGEDQVNGVSVVLPDSPLTRVGEYRIVPSSYVYRYKSNPQRSVLPPGKGADEYVCVWEHSKALTDKSPIPVILERCFFGDSNGLPTWKSVDGKWVLRFQKKSGYNGWVLIHQGTSGEREIRHDMGVPSGNLTGTWCGKYDSYVVSARIKNPLVAIGGIVLQSMALETAFKRASEETESGTLRAETADQLFAPILGENHMDTPLRITSRSLGRAIDELGKTGGVTAEGGQTVYDKYATEENTLGSFRSFARATIPYLEMMYCHRMMLFAMYPKVGGHRSIRDDSKNHAGFLNRLRYLYKSHGFASLCVPSVCSAVATAMFRPVRPHPNEEVRLAVDAPIMVYPTDKSQKNHANGFLRTPTNPAYGDMDQFVTFAANEDQLMKMVVSPWHAGGVPSWKPVVAREPGAAMLKAIYRGMRERAELPMYQTLGPMDVIRGIQYGFHRLRVSLFVSIRNGAMIVFAPMVKADYSNYLPRADEFWFGPMTQDDYLGAKNRFLRALGKRSERYDPRSRWFSNNSLIGNMVQKNLTSDQTTPVVLEMLRETVMYEKLNDCDFLINTRDFPKLRRDGRDPDHAVHGLPVDKSVDMPGFEHAKHLPVLGFNVHPQYADIPIPVPDDWKNAYGGFYGKDSRGSPRPNIPHPVPITEEQWSLRAPKAAFRGGATGVSSTPPMNQRLLLAEMVESLKQTEAEKRGVPDEDVEIDDFDVEVVTAAIRDKKVSSSGMEYMVPSGSAVGNVNTRAVIREDKRMPLRTPLVLMESRRGYRAPDAYTEQDRNQMAIYVDGNAAAYRYSSMMAAGFVILKVASRVGYEMWFYPALVNALPGSDDPDSELDDSRFNPAGDHILVDADMKNIQKIIHWVRDHPTQAIRIAENSIKKYKTLFRKSTLRQMVANAINLASIGQNWTRKLPDDKIGNVRLIEEPREAKSYRNALRLMEKRQEDRSRVMELVQATAGGDVVSDSVHHTRMSTQDAPTEGYEREDAPGIVVVSTDMFEGGHPVVEEQESLDGLPTSDLPQAELKKPSSVLSKYTHGALRRQVLRFAGNDDGEDVEGYDTGEEA